MSQLCWFIALVNEINHVSPKFITALYYSIVSPQYFGANNPLSIDNHNMHSQLIGTRKMNIEIVIEVVEELNYTL